MEKGILILTRIIWVMVAALAASGLTEVPTINPLHPLAIVELAAIVFGCVCIWMNDSWARMCASISGIVLPLIISFRILQFHFWFPNASGFSIHWKLFEFEGTYNVFAGMLPIIILLINSITLLWKEAGRIDQRNPPNKANSADAKSRAAD